MSKTKAIVEKTSETSLQTFSSPEEENTQISQKEMPSPDEVNLICTWWDRKKEVDSGLISITLAPQSRRIKSEDGTSCAWFSLENMDRRSEHYQNLLRAKVYDVFGVSDTHVALGSFLDCINVIRTSERVEKRSPEAAKEQREIASRNVMNLFQELRPRDVLELMLVTKLIILDYISNRELIGAAVLLDRDELRTSRQNKAIKLIRLFLEIKDKLDKHRQPGQQILVQHNHIHNEGQAIIGSQVSTGGGK